MQTNHKESCKMNTNESCAIIIVAYNNEATIGECLDSIFNHSLTLRTKVVVVDNSPGAQTGQIVKALENPSIELISRPENVGFAAACNLGAQGRTEDFLLFLNPDTKLYNDVPKILSSFLKESTNAKMVGPKILGSDGRTAKTCRNLPTPWRILADATYLDKLLGTYVLNHFDHQSPRAVEQIMGAAMFIKRQDYENYGGLDERFFIYYEEVDLCRRILDSGFELWFYPEAKISHVGGASCEALPVVNKMLWQLRLSRAQYFAKHFGLVPQFITLAVSLAEALGKAVVLEALAFLKPQRKSIYKAKAKGFWGLLAQWNQSCPLGNQKSKKNLKGLK